MSKPTEKEVKKACRVIVNNAEVKALNYAVNYAKVAAGMTGRGLQVQILYVLNNITHWRGLEAKEVRKTLKMFINDI